MGLGFGIGLPGPFSVGGRVNSRDVDDFWKWFWGWVFFLVLIAGWLIYWIIRGIVALTVWVIRTHRARSNVRKYQAEQIALTEREKATLSVTQSSVQSAFPKPIADLDRGGADAGSVPSGIDAGLMAGTIPTVEKRLTATSFTHSRPVGPHASSRHAPVPAAAPMPKIATKNTPISDLTSSSGEIRLAEVARKRAQILGKIALPISICATVMLLFGVFIELPILIGLAVFPLALVSGVLAVLAVIFAGVSIHRTRKYGSGPVHPSGLRLGIVAFCIPGATLTLAGIVVAIFRAASSTS